MPVDVGKHSLLRLLVLKLQQFCNWYTFKFIFLWARWEHLDWIFIHHKPSVMQAAFRASQTELHLNLLCSSWKSVILCHKLEDNLMVFSLVKQRLTCCKGTTVVHHWMWADQQLLPPLHCNLRQFYNPSRVQTSSKTWQTQSARVPSVAVLDALSYYPSHHETEKVSLEGKC